MRDGVCCPVSDEDLAMTNSEIMKAAHRQAKRFVCPGMVSYRQALAMAIPMMYAAVRNNVLAQSGGYAATSYSTLTWRQRDAMGLPL